MSLLQNQQPKRIVLSVGSDAEAFDSLAEFVLKKIRKDEEIVVVSDSNLVRITK